MNESEKRAFDCASRPRDFALNLAVSRRDFLPKIPYQNARGSHCLAHHKRKRPKSTRAGCLMCKPYKHQCYSKAARMKFGVKREASKFVCEVQ